MRAIRKNSRSTSIAAALAGLGWRKAVLLFLVVLQLGLIAHRIEHYLAPAAMECGEDECAAFSPSPGLPDLELVIFPLSLVAFFIRFWTARPRAMTVLGGRLGFRAHAPPF
jgi:hypothetical protein